MPSVSLTSDTEGMLPTTGLEIVECAIISMHFLLQLNHKDRLQSARVVRVFLKFSRVLSVLIFSCILKKDHLKHELFMENAIKPHPTTGSKTIDPKNNISTPGPEILPSVMPWQLVQLFLVFFNFFPEFFVFLFQLGVILFKQPFTVLFFF